MNQDRAVWQAAREYLENGWIVVPMSEASDRLTGPSRTLSGKLPARLLYYVNPINRLHRAMPAMFKGHGVGIATGRDSGLLVIDVDGETGLQNAALLRLPPTRSVKTGNGVHLYYSYPKSVQLMPSSPGGLADGIDIKGDDGFVNAPPSRHPEGGHYQRIDPDAAIAELPAELVLRIHALKHRPRWKLCRRYLYQKYIRQPFNAMTGI